MKYLYLLTSLIIIASCNEQDSKKKVVSKNWESRSYNLPPNDSLYTGKTYLSIYSEIYSYTAEQTFQLTATVSIHNTSVSDSVFIKKASYYNTEGQLIRDYIDHPIYVKPLESLQIVIAETDEEGGPGANFIFDWVTKRENISPFFEAVMISTSGQQGMSFTTQGIPISEPAK